MKLIYTLAVFFILASAVFSANLFVPDNYPTIQAAINAANPFDTIYVRAGTYVENIDFIGKAITVKNYNHTSITVIDGGQAGSVVTFQNGEGPNSVLEGFTIVNGTGTWTSVNKYFGGGIFCTDSSPTIRFNVIEDNTADTGAGIACIDDSSPFIKGNTIVQNAGSRGGGIACYTSSSPLIMDCVIAENTADYGGGIRC